MLLESFGECGEWRMCLRRTISLLFKNVEDVRRLKGRWVIFALPCPDLTLFGFSGFRRAFFACLNVFFLNTGKTTVVIHNFLCTKCTKINN